MPIRVLVQKSNYIYNINTRIDVYSRMHELSSKTAVHHRVVMPQGKKGRGSKTTNDNVKTNNYFLPIILNVYKIQVNTSMLKIKH